MLVRLLVSIASLDMSHGKGSVVDMPDDEAKRYIDAGMAISEDGHSAIENTDVKHHKEKAIKKKV